MTENEHDHGSYVRKVLDGGRRYTQELLEKNSELRALVAELQVREQHLMQQLGDALGQAKELRDRLYTTEQESRRLSDELGQARVAVAGCAHDREWLQALLSKVDDESRRHDDEFSQLQAQANNLANLYVASYRLHGTLSLRALMDAMREIIANLIGSQEVALFDVDAARQELVLLDAYGVDPGRFKTVPLGRGLMGAAVASGEPLVVSAGAERGPGEEDLTAVIPLRLVDVVIGVVAIFRLLPQKAGFEDLDRELFDLLASQAGMALHTTKLHARLAAVGAAGPAPPAA